jgi:hypothetical protein
MVQRLARLNTMPVDTSSLDAFIHQNIPKENAAARRWLRPLGAVAAVLVAAMLIGVLMLSLGDRPAVAAPAQVAQWHEQMATGTNVMRASDLHDANKMLARSDPEAPAVRGVEGRMSCCVHRVGDSPVTCIMLERDGQRVMVCVADGQKVKIPATSSTMARDGVTYTLMSEGAMNIVMAKRDGRWVACSGKMSHAALVDTAAGLKF